MPSVAAADVVVAAVEVQPARRAEMAFLIGNRVKEVHVRAGEQVTAGQPLITLEAPELEYAVVSAQAEVDSAALNAQLQSSSRQYRVFAGRKLIWTRGLPEVQRKAEARLELAQGQLAVAQAELAQATLVAPFSGTVVSIDAAPGETVQPNQVVLIIANLTDMQLLTTDLSERDVSRVRPGQAVRIALKALPEELEGTVQAVRPMAGESEDGDTVYEVTIALASQSPLLFWGMTGEASIQVDHP